MAKRDPELEHLASVPLFAGCTRDELALIRKIMTPQRFRANTEIVTEGEAGGRFHLITSGGVTVLRRGVAIRDLGAGDYFGEMALLDEGVRTATVRANTEVTTLGLAPFNFRPLLKNNGRLTYNILVAVSGRLRALETALFP
jgi:CRP/FNR family transcriptional regulator, cyclic AMP receptor protein